VKIGATAETASDHQLGPMIDTANAVLPTTG
jgi:hypothetical protein